MRLYEVMVIVNPGLSETDASAAVDRLVAQQVTALGGSVDGVDHWGKRRFQYEIDHLSDGYYSVVNLRADARAIAELHRTLGLADEIVRHKILKLEAAAAQPAPAPAT
jgi:small subunit ribosomal protein S6